MKVKSRIIETMKKGLVIGMTLILTTPYIHAQDEENKTEGSQFGLATDFGDVLIENLGIGRTYNLRELAGSPLKVRNRSSNLVNLVIDVTIPTEKMITRKRRNMGVEEIPTLEWVRVAQNEFILPPGETAFTDVIIDIPNDPGLYGKKFQASIHSHTTSKNFLQLGVWSHVVFTIVPSPEDQAKMEKNQRRGIKTTAEFTLLPDKVYITNFPLGEKFDVRKQNKRTIKLANSGDNPVTLGVQSILVADSPISMQAGFEQGDPAWLTSKKSEIFLDVDSVVDPGWFIQIPNKKERKGKKYMFIVKVAPTDKDVVSFTFYGRIYVEVEE